ncbi:hypothetical protein MXB_2359 [Myxobolus squamalis]|nr:hypothetical protein MXB_2359 [Myxobolus squamalis]
MDKFISNYKIPKLNSNESTIKGKTNIFDQNTYSFCHNIKIFKNLLKFEKILILTDYLNFQITNCEKKNSEIIQEEYNSLIKIFFDILNDWGVIKIVIDIHTGNFNPLFPRKSKLICGNF